MDFYLISVRLKVGHRKLATDWISSGILTKYLLLNIARHNNREWKIWKQNHFIASYNFSTPSIFHHVAQSISILPQTYQVHKKSNKYKPLILFYCDVNKSNNAHVQGPAWQRWVTVEPSSEYSFVGKKTIHPPRLIQFSIEKKGSRDEASSNFNQRLHYPWPMLIDIWIPEKGIKTKEPKSIILKISSYELFSQNPCNDPPDRTKKLPVKTKKFWLARRIITHYKSLWQGNVKRVIEPGLFPSVWMCACWSGASIDAPQASHSRAAAVLPISFPPSLAFSLCLLRSVEFSCQSSSAAKA